MYTQRRPLIKDPPPPPTHTHTLNFFLHGRYVVRSSVATMAIVSSSWGRVLICKVCVEVTCQADPRLKESQAVWARDGGSYRGLGAIFPCLPALLCCISSAGFRSLGVFEDCGSPPTSVLCFSFPRVMVDGKCLKGGL